ncbi:MAG: hypothetical protein KDA45_00670 [Planctomycetales bacterium]|nr:hypothetical protein [Planctomycetales bacterium]
MRSPLTYGSRRSWGLSLLVLLALPLWPNAARLLAADRVSAVEAVGEHLILVVGAGGEEVYAQEFERWSQAWKDLAARQQWRLTLISEKTQTSPATSALSSLQQAVAAHVGRSERLWIVLLGHGTFSRNVAKFNLPGPDVSTEELRRWLQPLQSPVVLINCSASSAPFLPALSGEQRIVLTATRSGNESNFSHFGKYLSLALHDLSADIDHDREVSLLEAFLAASAQTERFYGEDARLTTEHALLDDNGDRVGTPADFYQGIRPGKEAASGKALDGSRAARLILHSAENTPNFSPALSARREQIEVKIDALRKEKPRLAAEAYFSQLEQLLLELAAVYDAAESATSP